MNSFKSHLKNKTRQSSLVILSVFIAILSILGLAFIIIPLYLFRLFVNLISRNFKGKSLDKMLSLRSTIYACLGDLYQDHDWNICIAIIFQGKPDIDNIRKKVQKVNDLRDANSGKLLYPEMNQNISFFCGFPFWSGLKQGVNLSRQIHFYKENETQETNDDLVIDSLRKEILFKPYSKEEPFWEMIIYPNYKINPDKPLTPFMDKREEEIEKHFLLVYKFSHALADGASILSYLKKFSSPLHPNNLFEDKVKETDILIVSSKIWIFISFFYEISQLFVYFIVQFVFSLRQEFPDIREKKKENRLIFNVSRSISLEKLRRIKVNHPNVNGITVVFTAIAEALKLHLRRRIPPNLKIFLPLPLNGYDGSLTNHSTTAVFSLPMQNMDCISRMYKIQRNLEKMRKSSIPLVLPYVFLIGGVIPRWMGLLLYRLFVQTRAPNHVDLIGVSNVAVKNQLEILKGHPVEAIFATVAGAVCLNGLHIAPVSWNGHIVISVAGDVNILESQENANLFTENIYYQIDKILECKDEV